MLQCGTQRSDGSGLPPQSPSRWTHNTFPTTQKALPTSRKALGSAHVPSTNSSRSVQRRRKRVSERGRSARGRAASSAYVRGSDTLRVPQTSMPTPTLPIISFVETIETRGRFVSLPTGQDVSREKKNSTLNSIVIQQNVALGTRCGGWWWRVVRLAIARTVWHAPPRTARQHPGAH